MREGTDFFESCVNEAGKKSNKKEHINSQCRLRRKQFHASKWRKSSKFAFLSDTPCNVPRCAIV